MMKSTVFSLVCMLSGSVLAAADPTQPPGSYVEPVAGAAVDIGNAARLQSVIIRPGKKSVALIDGVSYGLGDRVGELQLVRITERKVILSGPQGKETLFLTPDVEVIPVKKTPSIYRSENK